MNQIQTKLLDIAIEFIKVCEKLNLSYFASGGTALGAARHEGFIPWDDDIDFMMPRKDYEILMKEGQKYLPSNLFIQNYKSDKNWLMSFAKIRDSNTTAIEKILKNLNINHGLWIDIFPLDILPINEKTRKRLDFISDSLLKRRYMMWWYGRYKSRKRKFKNFLIKFLIPSKKIAFLYDRHLAIKYNNKDYTYYWNNLHKRTRFKFQKEWFDDFVLLNFETIKIRVPKQYEKYLTEHYGNWKTLPPENTRKGGHTFFILDLSKSYKFYLNNKY